MDKTFGVVKPDGYKWLVTSCDVTGVQHYRAAAFGWLDDKFGTLSIQRQPDNPHDPNALAVIGRAGQIGHVPREIAALVAELPSDTQLHVSPRSVYAKGDFIRVAIAIFAKTELPVSSIADRAKDIERRKFEDRYSDRADADDIAEQNDADGIAEQPPAERNPKQNGCGCLASFLFAAAALIAFVLIKSIK